MDLLGTPFAISRQFIGRKGLNLECIPFAGPTKSSQQNSLCEHKLLAVGHWNEEIQVRMHAMT